MSANESEGGLPERDRLAAIGEIAAEMAHELRNLLQVVASSAFVARLAVSRNDAPAAQPHIGVIERTTRTAQRLVDDLMDLARGAEVAREAVLVTDVLSAARADFAPDAVTWNDAVAPPTLQADVHPGLVARLFHVLYENAVQASAPRAPAVTTHVRAENGSLVVEVSDDGPGVPESIAERCFEPFVTARAGGTGLGLALAKRIAEAHGGTIALLTSPNANERFVFRVVLPGAN